MKPQTLKRLRDALQAARLIAANTEALTRVEYESDPWQQSAVERQFEIIGEAFNTVRRLDPDIDTRIPDIHDWVSMRHFIAHVYDKVDNDVVWDTIVFDIPLLIGLLEEIVEIDS